MLYTVGIGDHSTEELNRLLRPVSVVIDIRHHNYPGQSAARRLPKLTTPVDHVPELGSIVNCCGPLYDRGVDAWLEDHVRHQIPNPWTYLEPYAYMWYTLTVPFILALDSLRFDGVCFLCDQEELLEEAIEHVKVRARPRRLDEMSTMKYKLEKEKMRREAKALEAAKTN